MLIDIHAKSSLSEDVSASVADILLQAKEAGLNGVAFVERLSTARCMEAIAVGEQLGVSVFIGVEIPSDRGLLLCFLPEIDSYYLNEEWRELTDYTTPAAADVIAEITDRGGAIIASRPYDLDIPFNMGDMIFTLSPLHGVEVYNSRVGEIQNDFALEAASFLGLNTAGGSDPRGDASSVGEYATFFFDDVTDQASFVDALLHQEFWAIQLGKVETQRSTRSSDPFAKRMKRGGRGDRDDRGDRKNGGRKGGDRKKDGDRKKGGRRGGGRGRNRGRKRNRNRNRRGKKK